MNRRKYLQTTCSLLGASMIPVGLAEAQNESSTLSISQTEFDAHGWRVAEKKPTLPSFPDEKHTENLEKTAWNLNAFYGAELPTQIEQSTPFENVRPLQHIWTARVTTTDETTKTIWRKGEAAEHVSNIDDTTEAAYEHFVQNSVLDSELKYRGEWHRKAVEEGAGFLSGLLPGGLGTAIDVALSWKWEMQSSIATETGNTATISEYYFSLPVKAISPDADEHVENELNLDFRGLYIDWFEKDDVFYATGGVVQSGDLTVIDYVPFGVSRYYGWSEDGSRTRGMERGVGRNVSPTENGI